jgi:hypothetical protein
MPGVKGRSGGARANAGRKSKPKPEPVLQGDKDLLQLLHDVALGRVEVTPLQLRAAIAGVQYTHVKKGDGGTKDERADKAKKAASGKFAAAAAPLKLVGRA